MTRLLPGVLDARYLPRPELNAARLDGEVFSVDECFQVIDAGDDAVTRGRALAATLPPRLIAEQRTAAWVLGALAAPPFRHELCAASGARFRALGVPQWIIREVVIDGAELCSFGGMQLTTPLRTVIDLARFSVEFGSAERSVVVALARIGGFELPEILQALDRRRNLPGKRRAHDRLTAGFVPGQLQEQPPPQLPPASGAISLR